MRFELTTPTLARLCSTPELRPRPRKMRFTLSMRAGVIAQVEDKCNSLIQVN